MPMQTTQSILMAKIGAKADAIVKKHAADPTEYGRMNLPAGINQGVARLIECKFDLYKTGPNQGKPYFRCAGVVVEPEAVAVGGRQVRVAGLQTSIMIPVCETKTQAGKVTTLEESVAKVLNEMRMLAGENATAGVQKIADLEPLAEAIKKARPHFKFSTSVRKAQKPGDPDGVWENWHGGQGLEDYSPSANGDGVVDETPDAEAEPDSPTTGEAGHTEDDIPFDYGELVAAAEAKDKSAQERLTELAKAAGCDDDAVASADDWAAVVALIEEQAAANGEPQSPDDDTADEPPAEEEWEPKKGDCYKYQIVDKAGKPVKDAKTGRARKPVGVEVLTVDKKSSTVTLKNLVTDKPVAGADGKALKVAWDALESAE